ncbi:MAG: SCO1664 family protein [Actinomycetota bacterium]|nr:SCO1664 family protein [Actinomycetota bacterium]
MTTDAAPVMPDPEEEVLEVLARAPLEILGRIVKASNLTLLCRLGRDDQLVVYKPERGEAPLWDFPSRTLHRREVAAYVLDRCEGGGMVPPTVLRTNGPFGPGSVQLFVDHDPDRHYFRLVTEPDPVTRAELLRMVVFDLIANNADRKGSHVLLDVAGHVRLVDHGLCFNVVTKLRTVAWDFADEPLPAEARAFAVSVAERLADSGDHMTRRLNELIDTREVSATAARARRVTRLERFPRPSGRHPLPWPPL